jgi:hypothetical protein
MFPLQAARHGWRTVNQEILEPMERDNPELAQVMEGILHGLLADELDKAGRHVEADAEYARAVHGLGDAERVRRSNEYPPDPTVRGFLCRSSPPYTRAVLRLMTRADSQPTR